MFAAISKQSMAITVNTHRCILDVPEYRAQYDYFEAAGKTKQEAIMNVIVQCENGVSVEDISLCNSYAFQDDGRNLHCFRGLSVPF